MPATSTLARKLAVPVAVGIGVLAVPTPASAATETFHRLEVVATANYTLPAETCEDGSTRETRVTVIGGHEEETENGVQTLDSDFLTVLVRGFDCAGNVLNDRASGPADFRYGESLKRATVEGTVTSSTERTYTVRMGWAGYGQLETDTNTTTFPGFAGKFTSQRRDAVAGGSVVADGVTLVDGRTTDAEIERLEDKNISRT